SCPASSDRLPAQLEAPEKSHRCRGFFFSSIPYLALEKRVTLYFPFVIFHLSFFICDHRRAVFAPISAMTNGKWKISRLFISSHAFVHELLNALSFIHLAGIDVALRIHRYAANAVELTWQAPAVAEARHHLERIAAQDKH